MHCLSRASCGRPDLVGALATRSLPSFAGSPAQRTRRSASPSTTRRRMAMSSRTARSTAPASTSGAARRKAMGREYRLIPVSQMETILQGLERNDYDAAIGAITITPGRLARVDFSYPAHRSGVAVAVRTGQRAARGLSELRLGRRRAQPAHRADPPAALSRWASPCGSPSGRCDP